MVPMTINLRLGIVTCPIRTVSNALWSKIVEHFFISAGVSKNHFDDFIFRVGESTIETWDGGFSLENLDLVDGSVVYASLRGPGGGKGVQKKTKDKKLQLVENLKKDIMEASQKINNDNIKNLVPVKAVEKKIADMMTAPIARRHWRNLPWVVIARRSWMSASLCWTGLTNPHRSATQWKVAWKGFPKSFLERMEARLLRWRSRLTTSRMPWTHPCSFYTWRQVHHLTALTSVIFAPCSFQPVPTLRVRMHNFSHLLRSLPGIAQLLPFDIQSIHIKQQRVIAIPCVTRKKRLADWGWKANVRGVIVKRFSFQANVRN